MCIRDSFYTSGGKGACSADGCEIDRTSFLHCLSNRLVPGAFADHAPQPQPQQGGRIGVHPAAGRRPAGADDLPGTGRCGTGVINDGVPHINGKRLSPFKTLAKPFVRGIPGGIDHAGKQNPVTGPKRGGFFLREGC